MLAMYLEEKLYFEGSNLISTTASSSALCARLPLLSQRSYTLIHLTSRGALLTQRYPNGLRLAYELKRIVTTYRRTYKEWKVLRRQALDPTARITPFELALRIILSNGFSRTVSRGPTPKSMIDVADIRVG